MTLNNALDSLLATNSAEQAARRITSAPKGFAPGVAYQPDGSMVVTTPPMPLVMEGHYEAAVATMIPVPEGYKATLIAASYDPAAWHRDAKDIGEKHTAYTEAVWRYKFKVEPDFTTVNAEDLFETISKWKPRKKALPEAADNGLSYVVCVSDCQGGKSDGGGTEAMTETFLEKIDLAVERLKELRRLKRPITDCHLVFLGDMVEGFVSQGGAHAWRTELTLVEQIRLYRRLALHAVKLLAPLVPRLVVVGINGNHGETFRVAGKMATRYDDNYDIEGLIQVADILADNPDFEHVSFVYPGKDEATVTLDMSGTIVGMAHGHLFGSNPIRWWSDQAHGQQPVGDASILLSGHSHHLTVSQSGAKTHLQAPALESESTWWKHRKGQVAPAGLLTLLIGGGSWQDLEVL